MRRKYLITILFAAVFTFELHAQQDSIIKLSPSDSGRGVVLNGRPQGHWKWISHRDRKIINEYYLDSVFQLIIEKNLFNHDLEYILLAKRDTSGIFRHCFSLTFNGDTLMDMGILNEFDFLKYRDGYTTGIWYYPNGLIKREVYYLKKNENVLQEIAYYPNQKIKSVRDQTDTTSSETEYYINGKKSLMKSYITNPTLYQPNDDWFRLTLLFPVNFWKHGEWYYFDENEKLVKIERYKEDKLVKTIKIK